MKNTTKRLLSLMLTLVMLLGMVPAFDLTARAVPGSGYYGSQAIPLTVTEATRLRSA